MKIINIPQWAIIVVQKHDAAFIAFTNDYMKSYLRKLGAFSKQLCYMAEQHLETV